MSRYRIPRTCLKCGRNYLARYDQGSFCSRACAQQRVKDEAPPRVPCPCAVCGKVRMLAPARVTNGRGKHCSYACRAIGISTHGETRNGGAAKSPEYTAWVSIKTRCLNPAAENYHNYGGRGIRICDEWRDDFPAFLAHVGKRPSAKHSIDRIDNANGHYEPGNVRWATMMEQGHNRRTNLLITYRGETHPVSEWSRLTGIGVSALLYRFHQGWSAKRILTQPVRVTRPPRRR